jgi:transcriptional regulator with XRE-family HTH domain
VKDEGKEKEENENELFGKLVKKYREKEHFTQEDFAHDVGCSVTYLSKIENGKANITFDLANRIASKLRMNFKDALRQLKADDDK